MFRYLPALMLVCAVSLSFVTKSERFAYASAERCLVPVEIAHGAIDLAFCEDLLASATLRPEFHVAVAKRVARVRAERADTLMAKVHLSEALAIDPLDKGLSQDFANSDTRHAQFVSAWQSRGVGSPQVVATLSGDDQ